MVYKFRVNIASRSNVYRNFTCENVKDGDKMTGKLQTGEQFIKKIHIVVQLKLILGIQHN